MTTYDPNLACKVWCVDIGPSGIQHRCHASMHGLDGNLWISRDRLEKYLKEKSYGG